jgi:hypothetical protein
MVATHAAASPTIGSSSAPASASTASACTVADGSLPGARMSGSSAWPKPPSALR